MNLEPLWRVYHIPIMLGMVSFLCIVFSIVVFVKSYQPESPITFSSDTSEATVAGERVESTIMVDVEGAVVHPGVYTLSEMSRVEEAITAAGGFATNADLEAVSRSINRAAKLSDGAKLYIPFIGEEAKTGENAPFAVTSGVNINTASQSELEALSGIGPVTAGKIISGRPYMRLEELVEKKAMSQSLFDKLKDQLSL